MHLGPDLKVILNSTTAPPALPLDATEKRLSCPTSSFPNTSHVSTNCTVGDWNQWTTPGTISENKKERHCTLNRSHYQVSQHKTPFAEFKLIWFQGYNGGRMGKKHKYIQLYRNISKAIGYAEEVCAAPRLKKMRTWVPWWGRKQTDWERKLATEKDDWPVRQT